MYSVLFFLHICPLLIPLHNTAVLLLHYYIIIIIIITLKYVVFESTLFA